MSKAVVWEQLPANKSGLSLPSTAKRAYAFFHCEDCHVGLSSAMFTRVTQEHKTTKLKYVLQTTQLFSGQRWSAQCLPYIVCYICIYFQIIYLLCQSQACGKCIVAHSLYTIHAFQPLEKGYHKHKKCSLAFDHIIIAKTIDVRLISILYVD